MLEQNILKTSKGEFKEKRISVTENLTKNRMKQLKRAREEQSFQMVWSQDVAILHIDVNQHNRVNVFYD